MAFLLEGHGGIDFLRHIDFPSSSLLTASHGIPSNSDSGRIIYFEKAFHRRKKKKNKPIDTHHKICVAYLVVE
jgi:hypothetical protein